MIDTGLMSVGSAPSGVFVSSANGFNFLNYSAAQSNDMEETGIVFAVLIPGRTRLCPSAAGTAGYASF
jgi:hypothetical protein